MIPRNRGVASTRFSDVVALAQVESPLECCLANFPGAVAHDAIEQHAAIVVAATSLLVRELHEFGRMPQGLRHVVLTSQYLTPFPPKREKISVRYTEATTVPKLRDSASWHLTTIKFIDLHEFNECLCERLNCLAGIPI